MNSPLQQLSSHRLNAMSSSPQKAGTDSTTDSSSQSQHSSSPTRKPHAQLLPQSPSLPEFPSLQRQSHVRTNSDVHVQGLVKRFEHLDVRDRDAEHNERRRRDEAKLRRAEIAREEAESDVSRYREELRALRKDMEEIREQERIHGRRAEATKDDFQREKEQFAASVVLYEKEIRRSRKEAFKSSSAVLKLQEELKSARNQLHVTNQTLDLEKQKIQRRDQDTFNAQYQLVSVQEEVDKLKMQLRVVEEEKEALKSSLQQEEVARIAAEGRIALPVGDDEFASPKKTFQLVLPHVEDDKENVPTGSPSPQKRMRFAMETQDLKDELARERRWRHRADDMVEFLQLECRFGCCACHRRQRLQRPQPTSRAPTPPSSLPQPQIELITLEKTEEVIIDEMEIDPDVVDLENQPASPVHRIPLPEAELRQSKTTTTTIPVHFDTPVRPRPQPIFTSSFDTPHNDDGSSCPPSRPLSVGSKPVNHTSYAPSHQAAAQAEQNDPGTAVVDPLNPGFDRAAALAAIEYRRGRAKSIAQGTATPRRAMLHGIAVRRDITR
ncbi:hypothetical protein K431DRAFT_315896 [Polychaeton citri CBS 116435]|uniref:Uncharacterized protein n=1 Tax=Polychaeton citri CBS 116435 TaxID=1314669 RepID=A0A9P4Q0M7_9PEZI|nr:hypothetical protein K431DRAFT_315896 [Polychaeton citri CBS 116435]